MGPTPNTSFIPKQGSTRVTQTALRRHNRFNFIGFIAILLLVISVALAVAVFVYQRLSNSELESAKQELAEKRNTFQPGDIASIRELDARMATAQGLLEDHASPSKLLDVLERATQKDVQYVEFEFTRRPSGDISVKMKGVAPRFNTVALQAERFAQESLFSQIIFSNLNKTTSGGVTFQVNFDIAKEAIAYEAPIGTLPPEEPIQTMEVSTSTEDVATSSPVVTEPEVTP